jgi:hypothetical protein
LANFQAIHGVGASLVRYLNSAFALSSPFTPMIRFELVSSGELNSDSERSNVVTLYLYRVTVDPHTRNVPCLNGTDGQVPLSLALHYLLSVWCDTAQTEQLVLGWVMRQLYEHQALTPSDLVPDAGWEASDVIQVVPSELTNEDTMRIWDALQPGYRLSVSYTARVVRIDSELGRDARPVVARLFSASTEVGRQP